MTPALLDISWPAFAALAVGTALALMRALLSFVAFLIVVRDASSRTKLTAFRILIRGVLSRADRRNRAVGQEKHATDAQQ